MIGRGSIRETLNEQDVAVVCNECIERERRAGKHVLAVIPGNTRSAPIDVMFRVFYTLIAASRFDEITRLAKEAVKVVRECRGGRRDIERSLARFMAAVLQLS